jgi:hypothetical protein
MYKFIYIYIFIIRRLNLFHSFTSHFLKDQFQYHSQSKLYSGSDLFLPSKLYFKTEFQFTAWSPRCYQYQTLNFLGWRRSDHEMNRRPHSMSATFVLCPWICRRFLTFCTEDRWVLWPHETSKVLHISYLHARFQLFHSQDALHKPTSAVAMLE